LHTVVEIHRKVLGTIRRLRLLQEGDRIVLGVSGGPDSVALLHILFALREQCGWTLAVAHLHHGLRGRDAEEDLEFVQGLSQDLGLPFFHGRLPEDALRSQKGSLQEAARKARYDFLESVRSHWGARCIAVGHQADDQAETVLAALLRGAGTKGLAGIPYVRGSVIRPILDLTREEILRYLDRRGLPYRVDPSNEQETFLRNRIRHHLLPLLREFYSPRIDDRLRRIAHLCAQEDAFMEASTDQIWRRLARLGDRRVEIPLSAYRETPAAVRLRLLRRSVAYLRGDTRGLSWVHLVRLDELALEDGRERWVHLPGRLRGVVGGGAVMLGWEEEFRSGCFRYPVEVPGETTIPEAGLRIRWELVEGTGLSRRRKGEGVLLDLEAMDGELVVRSPLPGDRFRPAGLGGSRKVKDLLIDAKVPRRDRWRVPVLVDRRGPLWVVGHRLDERVRPGPETKKILKAVPIPM